MTRDKGRRGGQEMGKGKAGKGREEGAKEGIIGKGGQGGGKGGYRCGINRF